MKKIITAIGNPFINENLSKEKNIKIIGKDILYLDAIFEIIKNNKIDFLIINETIFENLDIIKKINEIKKINNKIKIIIFLNKEKNIINKIKNKKNIYIIFYNKKNNNKKTKKIKENFFREILEIIKIIVNNKSEKNYFEIEFENNKNKNIKVKIIKLKNKLKKFIIKKEKREKDENYKNEFYDENIITVFGSKCIGKDTFTKINKKFVQNKNQNKILIIDFDIYNQNLYSKFNKKSIWRRKQQII